MLAAAVTGTVVACGSEVVKETGAGGSGGVTSSGAGAQAASSSQGPGGTGGAGACSGYTTADTTPCDPLSPATCAQGTHCTFVDDVGTLGCRPDNAGSRGMGQPCVDSAECSGSLECIGGQCAPWCCPENDQPCGQVAGLCDVQVAAPNNDQVWIMSCTFEYPSCLLMDLCPVGTFCHPMDFASAQDGCEPPSGPNAPVGEDNPCMYRNDCGESELCENSTMPAVCRQICDLTNWMTLQPPVGGCPPLRICTPVNWGNNVWFNFGLCLP